MREIELIANLAQDEGIALSRLSTDSGMSNYTLRKARANGGSISTRNASAALGVLGYALCAVPADDIPPNAYVIDDVAGE